MMQGKFGVEFDFGGTGLVQELISFAGLCMLAHVNGCISDGSMDVLAG